jgi:ATP/maltotriose-dependent transcriptional regulator MalT
MAMLQHAARIYSPQPRKNWIPRARLISELYDALDCKLIVVVAGAGYGKTTLLSQFVSQTDDFSFAWVSLDASDRDLRAYAELLLASLRRTFPSLGMRIERVLSDVQDLDRNIDLLARAFLAELADVVAQPTFIILDDFHLIESSQSILTFHDQLITELPDDAHLILASRAIPKLQLGMLIAQQQVRAIGQSALKLTQDETRQIVSQLLLSQADDARIARIMGECDGWMVGTLLLSQVDQLRESSVGVGDNLTQEALKDYMLVKVFDRLSPTMQRFLLQSSVLDEINIDFCVNRLKWKDVNECLAEMERQNMFIHRIAGTNDDMTYRYHALFRDFLQARLREIDPTLFRETHRQAGAAYLEIENVERAIKHFLDGDYRDDAMRAMEQPGVALLSQGRYSLFLEWFARLGKAHHDNHRLRQMELQCYINLGRDDEALRALEDLDAWYRARGDDERRDLLRWWRAMNCNAVGDYAAALRHANYVVQSPHRIPPIVRAEAMRIAAQSLLEMGELDQAMTTLEKAREQVIGNDVASVEALLRNKRIQAEISLQRGDYDAAYRSAFAATEMAEQLGNRNLIALAAIVTTKVKTYYDNLADAMRAAEYAHELAKATGNRYYRDIATDSLLDVWMATGKLDEAFHLSESRSNASREANSTPHVEAFVYHSHILQLQADRSTSAEKRKQLLSDALEICHQAVASLSPQSSPRIRLAVFTRLAAIHLARESMDSARAALHTAHASLAQFNNADSFRLHSMITMVSDRVSLDFRNAKKHIQREIDRFPTTWTRVARAEGKSFTKALQEIGVRIPLESLASQPIATISSPRIVEYRAIGFGVGAVWRNGQPIPYLKWGGIMPREMFFYLLVKKNVHRDRIGAEFWPDASQEGMQRSFHVCKSTIRNVLGKAGVVYDDGMYQLNPDLDCEFDVDEFRSCIDKARFAPPRDAFELLLRAGALYRDDFLMNTQMTWAEDEQRQLRTQFISVCRHAAELAIELKEEKAALDLLQQANQREKTRHDIAAALIRLQERTGLYDDATDTKKQFYEFLQQEKE